MDSRLFINKVDRVVLRGIYILFFLTMMAIVLLCLFFSFMDYAGKMPYSNLVLFPAGVAFTLLTGIAVRFWGSNLTDTPRLRIIVLLLSLGFTCLQFIAIDHYYFYTGWDAQVLRQCAYTIAEHGDIGVFNYYFSAYPNNLLLAFLISLVIRFCNFLGIGAVSYPVLLGLQCLICWITGLLTASITYRLTKQCWAAILAHILYTLLIGLSPWFSIPYSDAIALLFPAAIFRLYIQPTKTNRTAGIKWFSIAVLTLIGYQIKPQAAIVTIAIVLVQLIKLTSSTHRKTFFRRSIAFALGLCCAATVAAGCIKLTGIHVDKEKTFGISHFLMMGLNTNAKGVWAEEDVLFSSSAETAQQRNQQNLAVCAQRLKEMGLSGFLKQLARKTLTNYNDGTFFWGGEGNFYLDVPERSDTLSSFLWEIFNSETGSYYPVFCNIMQLLWLGILALSIAALTGKADRSLAVLMLSIIGVTLFQGLFEARARYLFLYAPFYILLATVGVSKICVCFSIHKKS